MPDARVVKEHRKVRIQYDLEDIVVFYLLYIYY